MVGVEQDHRVGQDVDSISVLEQHGALLVVVGAEALHDAVDLLGLARQPEALQEGTHCPVESLACNKVGRVLRNPRYRNLAPRERGNAVEATQGGFMQVKLNAP